jgi:protein-arginine kinase activator protein McsA
MALQINFMNKIEILKTNLETRIDEVQNYQINIDNFGRSIKKIEEQYSDNEKMIEFKNHLIKLLEENETEQLKAIIIRDVIEDQIKELGEL